MSGYDLPKTIGVGGVEYSIRSDFRAILDILMAFSDPELDDRCRADIMLKILYVDWETIPPERINEALEKACGFIDCGQKDDGKPHPKTVDWEQDAGIIVPAVNSVAGTEVRALPYLHWWSFFGYFMEIRESLFSSVINIRQKKAKHKKLEKWEQDFYKENRDIIDLKVKETEEQKQEKENLLKWL
jgi:hypothetical protein